MRVMYAVLLIINRIEIERCANRMFTACAWTYKRTARLI